MCVLLEDDLTCNMDKIYQIIEKNNIVKLQAILEEERGKDNVSDGWTPLTYACERGREEIVDILIEDIKQNVRFENMYKV